MREFDDKERAAHWANEARKEQARQVADWLKANPEIGQLNGGRFYVIEDGEPRYLEPLEQP